MLRFACIVPLLATPIYPSSRKTYYCALRLPHFILFFAYLLDDLRMVLTLFSSPFIPINPFFQPKPKTIGACKKGAFNAIPNQRAIIPFHLPPLQSLTVSQASQVSWVTS